MLRATTSAPESLISFLRQRRRWFGGFLQTQFWYRDMVGNRQYRRLGTWMLPVKAADTMQPIYGLFAFALLLFYIVTGKAEVLLPVGGFIIGKNHPRSGFPRLVNPALSQLDRWPHQVKFWLGIAGCDHRAVQLPTAPPPWRQLGLGTVCYWPARMELISKSVAI